MTDLARLVLETDTRGLKKGEIELERLAKTGEKTEKSVGKLSKTSVSTSASLGRLGDRAKFAALGLLSAASAAAALGKTFSAAGRYTEMTNSLRAMGLSAEEAVSALDQVAQVAVKTRAPLEATAKLYQRITIAGRDLGASSGDVLQFAENVGLALAQTGTSAQEASGALLQLSQAMAGGIVRAEEFNSILEGAFPIAQAAANGIDEAAGSVGRLRQMIVAGDITSREFFEAILSQTDQLNAAFANTQVTVGQAFTVLNTNFTIFAGKLNDAFSVTQTFANAILTVSENVGRIAAYAVTAAVAFGGRFAIALGIAAARTIALSASLVALRAAIARTGFGLLVVAAGELVYQFGRLVAAAGGFGNAMELLGNVALEVWDRIKRGGALMGEALANVAWGIEGKFKGAFGNIAASFASLTQTVANGINGLLGTSLSGIGADFASELLAESEYAAAGVAVNMQSIAGSFRDLTGPIKALEGLNKAAEDFSVSAAEGAGAAGALGDALGGGGGGRSGGAGGAAKSAAEQFADADIAAQDLSNTLSNELSSAADGVGRVLGDGLLGNFENAADQVRDVFKRLLSDLIATATANQIKIALGLQPIGGAGGVPGVAQATGGFGGIGSSLIGSAAMGTGFAGGMGGFTSLLTTSGIGPAASYVGSTVAAAGSNLAAFGTALGAVALPLLGVTALISGFREKVEVLKSGFQVNVNELDISVRKMERTTRSRAWGLSKATSTRYSDAGDAADPIRAAFGQAQGVIMDVAAAVGIADDAFAGFADSVRLNFKGKNEAERAEELAKAITAVTDGMAELALATGGMGSAWEDLAMEGEGASAVLTRIVGELQAVNAVLDYMGQTALSMSLSGAKAADGLVSLFGGVEAFQAATSNFTQKFYSESERLQMLSGQTVDTLTALNIAMPKTRLEFRRIVEAQDLTTDRGREVYAALISMADAMDQILPAATALTAGLSDAFDGLAGPINDAITEANENLRAAETAARAWESAADTLEEFSRDLANAYQSGPVAMSANQAAYNASLAAIRGGDAGAAGDFPNIARDLVESARRSVSTSAEFNAYVKKARLDALKAAEVARDQVDYQQRLVELYELQGGLLEDLRDFVSLANNLSEEQIAQLGGIDAVLKGMDVTLAGYDGAFAQIQSALDNPLAVNFADLKSSIRASFNYAGLTKTIREAFAPRSIFGSVEFKSPFSQVRDAIGGVRDAVREQLAYVKQQAKIAAAQAKLQALAAKQQTAIGGAESAIASFWEVINGTSGLWANDRKGEAAEANTARFFIDDSGRLRTALGQYTYNSRGASSLDDARAASAAISSFQSILDALARQMDAARAAVLAAGGVPSFATGGFHSGGVALVGEEGPELINTGPARITSNSGTEGLFGDLIREVRMLREEVKVLKDASIATATNTERSERISRKWDKIGIPATQA